MLIPLPVVFFVTAFVTDLVFWWTGYEIWAIASMWFLGAGIVMALAAALFGFIDFVGDARIRDISDAWQHLIGNLVAVVLVLINWFIRYKFGAAAGVFPWDFGFPSSPSCCWCSTAGKAGKWSIGITSE